MLSKEYEKRLLILYSLSKHDNKATKKKVLDYLENNNLVKLTADDKKKRESRNEETWRNSFAYIRQHLVKAGYLSKKDYGYWEITRGGEKYFERLCKEINLYKEDSFRYLNNEALEKISKMYNLSDAEKKIIYDVREDIESYEIEEARFEGEKKERLSNYYERDPHLRKLAIEYHGFNCKACGFNFYKKYGERGINFIEVHHMTPVSKLDGAKEINYETDMTVLCANCHRMIHRKRDELLSIEELKKNINV